MGGYIQHQMSSGCANLGPTYCVIKALKILEIIILSRLFLVLVKCFKNCYNARNFYHRKVKYKYSPAVVKRKLWSDILFGIFRTYLI